MAGTKHEIVSYPLKQYLKSGLPSTYGAGWRPLNVESGNHGTPYVWLTREVETA